MDESITIEEIREKILKHINDALDQITDNSAYTNDVKNSLVVKNLTEAYNILREYM